MLNKRKRWNIWVLSEEDIDLEAERMGVTLTADQKQDVARLFKKGFEAANLEWDSILRDAIAQVKDSCEVVEVRHTIRQIASNPQDYKYCNACGVINWYENDWCHECACGGFNPMERQDAKCLLKDWKGEEDFRLPVA